MNITIREVREVLFRAFAWMAMRAEPAPRTTVVRVYQVDRGDGCGADRIEIMSPEGVQVFHESILHPLAINPNVPLVLEHTHHGTG